MANILIYSNNPRLTAHWTHALMGENNISMLTNIRCQLNADAVLFDAKKLDEDKSLLSTFADKSVKFLVVGSNWPEEKQIEIMLHGAAGYCEATESTAIIKRAIECILKGDIWIRRGLVPKVIGSLTNLRRGQVSNLKPGNYLETMKRLETLSVREIEVADLIQSGENNKRIAMELNISERTVKAHLSSIFRKLEVDDRLHLAILLKELGQHRKEIS